MVDARGRVRAGSRVTIEDFQQLDKQRLIHDELINCVGDLIERTHADVAVLHTGVIPRLLAGGEETATGFEPRLRDQVRRHGFRHHRAPPVPRARSPAGRAAKRVLLKRVGARARAGSACAVPPGAHPASSSAPLVTAGV
jgi:hypothetical protein